MKLKEVRFTQGETRKVVNDWSADCEERSATVSASSWESATFTLASASLTGNVATVMVTCSSESSGLLRNTVTLSNGEVLIGDRDVFCYE